MIDITEYRPVIMKVLAKLKVRKDRREDMLQECYLALVEKTDQLADPNIKSLPAYVARVCRNRVVDVWWKENQADRDHELPSIRFDSLSEPKVAHRAAKIGLPAPDRATDEELQEAILSLPLDQYRVIYNIFIEGKSQEQTADDLGLTRRGVRTILERGIKNLKLYFEVED
jgi:RNA polymerase sigma factor (sigma-70 family)